MPKNDTIFKRLNQATKIERKNICDILNLDKKYINDIEKISKEFRSVSGHSVANTFRDEHGLEYLTMLKDTYIALISTDEKNNFDYLNASESELEEEVEDLFDFIYMKILNSSNSPIDDFRKKIESMGASASAGEAILGGGFLGLGARLISLPVSVVVTGTQIVSSPTYRKTFLVVAKLIEIKKRVRMEKILKDEK